MTTQLLKNRARLIFGAGALAVGYTIGLIGYLWDWQQHLAGLDDDTPHLAMYVAGLLVLGVLVGLTPLWPRRSGYLATYVWLLAGVSIYAGSLLWLEGLMTQHVGMTDPRMLQGQLGLLVGVLLLLALLTRMLWVLVRSNAGRWVITVAAGIIIVLGGFIFDFVWHQMNLGGEEGMGERVNMLALPPHQLILAGWLVGLIAASILLIKVRVVRDKRQGAA